LPTSPTHRGVNCAFGIRWGATNRRFARTETDVLSDAHLVARQQENRVLMSANVVNRHRARNPSKSTRTDFWPGQRVPGHRQQVDRLLEAVAELPEHDIRLLAVRRQSRQLTTG
jgi:hypothetical protein